MASLGYGTLFSLEQQYAYYVAVCFSLILASFFLGLIVYDKFDCRAFALGALPPHLFWVFVLSDDFGMDFSLRIGFSIATFTIFASGFATLVVRRYSIEKNNESDVLIAKRSRLTDLLVGIMLGLLLTSAICVIEFVAHNPIPIDRPISSDGGVI